MAIQFQAANPILTQRVLKTLGLTEEWLDTAEAKEFFFGKEVTYDPSFGQWEIEEAVRRPVHVI